MNADRSRQAAITLLILLLGGSLIIAATRTGLLSWLCALFACAGLLAMRYLQGRQALYGALLVVSITAALWVGSVYYVYSTWESGEVVQIRLGSDVHIRTWVVEQDGQDIVLYDCPPAHTPLLESGETVVVTRGGTDFEARLRAVPVTLDSAELGRVYGLYEQKYGGEGNATNIYYLLIGARRGSQLYVLYLSPTTTG